MNKESREIVTSHYDKVVETFGTGDFDLVISHMTFMHLSDPLGVMCQAYEMLKPQGELVVDDFRVNGLRGRNNFKALFTQTNCEVKIPPKQSPWPDEDKPRITVIQKLAEGRLNLPVIYDLEESTRAAEVHRAEIFYKLDKV